MDANRDIGDVRDGDGIEGTGSVGGVEGFEGIEDRIRELLEHGAMARSVSPTGVIRGARRRRVRHRATAAGSSLAVLGVAAGAVAFGANSAGTSRAIGPGSVSKVTSAAPAPKTCSPTLTGTVPPTTSTTIDGLDFVTVSGTTMGFPWVEQIHVFPNKEAHTAWMNEKPAGTYPPGAADAFHSGAMAQFRQPGVQGYGEIGAPSSDQDYYSFAPGGGLGPGTPVPGPGKEVNGKPVHAIVSYQAYRMEGWTDPKVDHACLQYADHAEFVPVYRIQGEAFVLFGCVPAEHPQAVISYDAAGKVLKTSKAVTMPADGAIMFQPWGATFPQD